MENASTDALTLNGKFVIFKTLAISKIVYISSISSMSDCILNELKSIHINFIWNNKRPKIKHSTLISDISDGGLRDVDIESKIKALQLSWLKRFYDDNFHPWKLIPKYLFSKFSPSCIFFPNFVLDKSHILNKFPLFYQDFFKYWSDMSHSAPLTPSSIMSESLWYNIYIKIDNKTISPSIFRNKIKKLFVADFFDHAGNILSWVVFKELKNVDNTFFLHWRQIIHALPKQWKRIIADDG